MDNLGGCVWTTVSTVIKRYDREKSWTNREKTTRATYPFTSKL